MQKQVFNFQIAKEQIDIVDYLASLGHYHVKKTGRDYKYFSPLPDRNERTPSFTVDRVAQQWYDHGIGKGGDLITLVEHYYSCTKKEVRQKLMDYLSFHPQSIPLRERQICKASGEKPEREKKIVVLNSMEISDPSLVKYAENRGISNDLLQHYCREVDFTLNGRLNKAIGFKNDVDGWELRNAHLKCSSSPKWPTTLSLPDSKPSQTLASTRPPIAVFEGFFDFLSFLIIQKEQLLSLPPVRKFLILNGLAFFGKSQSFLNKHGDKFLFLDTGKGANGAIALSKNWGNSYHDCRSILRGEEDLNALLTSLRKQNNRQILERKVLR